MRAIILLAGIAGFFSTSSASAQNLQVYGSITSITVSGAYNFPLRVIITFNGVNQFNSCFGQFAFVPFDDSNYQVKVAALLNAYYLQKPISVMYIDKEAVTNYCKILEFIF